MLIGVTVPNSGPLAHVAAAVDLAVHAEAAGFDSAWVTEHVLLPARPSQPYPYTKQQGFTLPPSWPFLDPLLTLTAIAARTSRILLGTGVYLLPLRHPVANAKTIASLDILSRGRLRLGVGLGWVKEEYDTLGIPWEQRGAVFDEQIDLIRLVWRSELTRFDGRFFQVDDIGSEPKPTGGRVPLLIGGTNAAARRRAARRGDGWHLIDLTPEEVAAAKAALAEDCQAAGTDPALVPISMYASVALRPEPVADAEREFPMMGTLEQVMEMIPRYAEAGVAHLVLSARGLSSADEYRALFDRLAPAVLPLR